MPELPDITVYIDALRDRIEGDSLQALRLSSPFFLRSAEPDIGLAQGRRVTAVGRLGKRIVIGLEGDYALVIHLMIAGRLQWRDGALNAAKPSRRELATLVFERGVLTVTEAGTKKRASLHFVHGPAALAEHDPGGLEVLDASFAEFDAALLRENRTLKRALTDPRIFSGIGNAYSDEILHRARLSPVALTQRLTLDERERMHAAVRAVLLEWTASLRAETGARFPQKVTAFRPGMAAHGRYNEPCPVCSTRIQRIRYASRETNYCPRCQTGGKVLADRSLSRLLKKDWPRDIESLEKLRG